MALLEVGRIAKPHGLRGEVIVALTTDRTERLAPGTVLQTADATRSNLRALRVLRSSHHQGRWIVAFDGIADRTAAEGLRGTILKAEPLEDPDTLWVHDLIGSEVSDSAGNSLGTVTAVEANPASDLIVLDGGGLIPLRFVVDRESASGRLVVEIPDGLLD